MSNQSESIRLIFGIVIIGILTIMAMSKGFDGEILKYAILSIVVLAIGDKAVEYYLGRDRKE